MSALGYGMLMAIVDAIVFTVLKLLNVGGLGDNTSWILPCIAVLYSLQMLLFYKSLKNNGLAQMNMLSDLLSIILVTGAAVLYFGEITTTTQKAGIALGLVSVLLMK
jgi:drug/metabolite transporter (DMT)-like permease